MNVEKVSIYNKDKLNSNMPTIDKSPKLRVDLVWTTMLQVV